MCVYLSTKLGLIAQEKWIWNSDKLLQFWYKIINISAKEPNYW